MTTHWCNWCQGRGCVACFKKRPPDPPKPIFSAQPDDPQDMEALRRVIGKDALEHAFGPEGEGVAEIERSAAYESILQLLRKGAKPQTPDEETQ